MSKQTDEFIPGNGPILYVDIGNSSIKAAWHSGAGWNTPEISGISKAGALVRWINSHEKSFARVVIGSVRPRVTEAVVEKLQTDRCRVLTRRDIPRDLLHYETPESLGVDRFFACYGAVTMIRSATVVIDAGTACTVDFMSADFVYRGGVIMPGIGILEKAFRESAPSLPRVEREIPGMWPGFSTKECLQWGLSGSVKASLNTYLTRYEETFGNYKLMVTGGDAGWISSMVDRSSKVRPMLIFEGMRRFLEDGL